MHRGALRAVGAPDELKARISRLSPHATLEDVFRHYAASDLGGDDAANPPPSGSIRQVRSSRKVARRVG